MNSSEPEYFSDERFSKWFPSKTSSSRLLAPSLRLICLHGAGMEQMVFTNRGNMRSPMPNPLLDYCEANNIQLLAVQLPGRSTRFRETHLKTAQQVAEELFSVLRPLLVDEKQRDIGYALLAHSMGCFCMYEFIRVVIRERMKYTRTHGSSKDNSGAAYPKLPVYAFLSSSIPPDTPLSHRPWKPSKGMSDQELQEEARGWDVNPEVFRGDIWSTYQVLFRNDFPLFDEYVMSPIDSDLMEHAKLYRKSPKISALQESGQESVPTTCDPSPRDAGSFFPPLGVDCTCWYPSRDKRITEKHALDWKPIMTDGTANTFETKAISDANHSFLYDKDIRAKWMQQVVEILAGVLQSKP